MSSVKFRCSTKITDTDFALDILNPDRKKAIIQFVDFHNKKADDRCLDIDTTIRHSDEEATEIIKNLCGIDKPSDLQKMEPQNMLALIRQLRHKYNLSIRQIERLTGIDRNKVSRA